MSDEYVDRATTLSGSDAPSEKRMDGSETKQNYYNRLAVANSLDWNGKWRDERRATRKDSVAIVDAIASTLELTDFQTERAQKFFESLPKNYNEAYSTALLALCVCGLSGRKDGRRYHPNRIHPNTDDECAGKFEELADDLSVEYSRFYSCWNRVEGELS